jgi:stage VI sporulation protein D
LKGGVALSQGNQSFLRFSLEESVWFQRGQEVEELLSVSLDPNITIQESDQYVTIRGTLEFTGEYTSKNDSDEEERTESSLRKWIQAVEVREDGQCEFSHEFPIDITIPAYRVRDLSEIDVLIETFDYAFPERSCLKLTADLNVTGLYGETVQAEVEESVEEQEEEVFELSYRFEEESTAPEEHEDPDYEPFEVEARKEDTFFSEAPKPESSSSSSSSLEEVQSISKTPEISFSSHRAEESPESPQQQPVLEVELEADKLEVEVEVSAQQDESSSESGPNIVEHLKKKLTSKKSMSISEFLARKEGEEHTKVKVCIVQHGETVERLAERYEVPVLQLLKVNRLEPNQDVYEGQVLYIPHTTAPKF